MSKENKFGSLSGKAFESIIPSFEPSPEPPQSQPDLAAHTPVFGDVFKSQITRGYCEHKGKSSHVKIRLECGRTEVRKLRVLWSKLQATSQTGKPK